MDRCGFDKFLDGICVGGFVATVGSGPGNCLAHTLESHSEESAGIGECFFELFDALFCFLGIAGLDKLVEFLDDSIGYCFCEPIDHMLFEPGDIFLVEVNRQAAADRFGIGCVGEQDPFEFEGDHADVGVIGDKEAAGRIVQVIRIVSAMVLDSTFDSFPFADQSGGCVQGWIESSDAP